MSRFAVLAGATFFAQLVTLDLASAASTPPKWQCSRVVANDPNFADGAALGWARRDLSFAFSTSGTKALDNSQAEAAVRLAFKTWSSSILQSGASAASCASALSPLAIATSTDLTFTEASPSAQTYAGYNFLAPETNVNLILFRDDVWDHPESGYFAGDFIALTTVTYSSLTGAILDADIEFNTKNVDFATDGSAGAYDLQNTATHEIGHFLGFGHSTDSTAVMYLSARPGDTSHQALSCYDAAALWFRYPAGSPLQSCKLGTVNNDCGQCQAPGTLGYTANAKVTYTNDGDGGCDCATSHRDARLWLFILAGTTLARARRRRRLAAIRHA